MHIRDYMFTADPASERQRLSRQARLFAEQILDKARSIAGNEVHQILDLGCGTGEATLVLRRAYPRARIAGIDRDQHALALARRAFEELEAPDMEYVLGDAETELPKGPFDLVFASMFLSHVRRPARVLSKAYAAMADGGCFWSRTLAPPSRDENMIYSQRLLHAYLDAIEAAPTNICIAPRIPAMLAEAGFTNVASDQEPYPIGGPTSSGKDLALGIVYAAYQARPLISGIFGTPDELIHQMYKEALYAVQRAGDNLIGTQYIINHVARKGLARG
jgi:ubiquinone/menaquinone biosynthesis C-methylase UbiE